MHTHAHTHTRTHTHTHTYLHISGINVAVYSCIPLARTCNARIYPKHPGRSPVHDRRRCQGVTCTTTESHLMARFVFWNQMFQAEIILAKQNPETRTEFQPEIANYLHCNAQELLSIPLRHSLLVFAHKPTRLSFHCTVSF